MDPTLGTMRETIRMAPRPRTLEGVPLGLLANGKTHGDRLLDLVADELAGKYRLGALSEHFHRQIVVDLHDPRAT